MLPARPTLRTLARIIARLPGGSAGWMMPVLALLALLALLVATCQSKPVEACQDAAPPAAGQESPAGPEITPEGRALWVDPSWAGAGRDCCGQPGDQLLIRQPASESGLAAQPAIAESAATDAASLPAPGVESRAPADPSACCTGPWQWKMLPEGLLYPSYLADTKDSRLGTQLVFLGDGSHALDSSLGARVGLLRYGAADGEEPEGSQFDVEGAVFPRLLLDKETELESADYRFGASESCRLGPWEGRLGYYHLCSHLGDSVLLEDPSFPRVSYVRDCLTLGLQVRPWPDVRFYSEVGYGVHVTGEAKEWELKFGGEYVHAPPDDFHGGPFLATHCHLRQDNDFSGNVTVALGWAWRTQETRLFRVGVFYFNGLSEQYQFFNKFEEQLATGMWYDF
jgi:hypothetical protein